MPSASDAVASSTPFWSSYSLRTRYLAVTAIVTILIVAGALFAQRYVERAGEMRSKNLLQRNEAVSHIRQLRNAILQVEKTLDAFLWRPTPEQRELVTQSLNTATEEQQRLYHLDWFTGSNMAAEMDDFISDIQRLRISVDHLMAIRLDPAQQDPYLAIHKEIFQPATLRFNTAITAVLQQIESENDSLFLDNMHTSLEEIRNEWMQIDILAESYSGISSATTGDMQSSFKAIKQRHQSLLDRLNQLDKRFQNESVPVTLIRDWRRLRASAMEWSRGFSLLQQLVEEGRKRGDIHFMVTTIEPQLTHIWTYLQRLDETVEKMASVDVSELAAAATAIAHALWALAFIGLALLVTGLIYFERSVLSPIVMVAKALRNEARGHAPIPLPQAQSRETHHLIEAFSQMREQVQQRQQSLEYIALHDPLTGLANREQLVRTTEQILHDRSGTTQSLAILIISLDRFREINMSLGHAVGDQLLKAVALRLTHISVPQRLVARLGGDEFALLLHEKAAEAESIARVVIKELEYPFEVANQSLFLSASIGIALAPENGTDSLALLQKADVAAHVAKRHRSSVIYYGKEHDAHALRRLGLANTLRLALHGQESGLALAYQPQIDIFNRQLTGVEVLLRWNHPEEGSISPDELIPIAEHTGLIYQLTPWVLERAFAEFSRWQALVDNPVLAINLSVHNLYDADFPEKLGQLMKKWEIKPTTLQLEITESAMMADPILAQRTLIHIHKMGVELVIDDFGTGFSSLTYLKHLPVSKLKIDKSFVLSMLENDNDAVIIRSTIDMAHNLGLKVVAEGVENIDTLNLLEILGCDVAQGFYFSRPLELDALIAWAQQHATASRRAPLSCQGTLPSLHS